jgi:hypothetical protein
VGVLAAPQMEVVQAAVPVAVPEVSLGEETAAVAEAAPVLPNQRPLVRVAAPAAAVPEVPEVADLVAADLVAVDPEVAGLAAVGLTAAVRTTHTWFSEPPTMSCMSTKEKRQ